MAQAERVSGNQNREIRKGEWQQATFKSAEWDSTQMGKKGKRGTAKRFGETEKGIPQHIPKKVTSQGLSKESKLKEGKNEKKQEIEPAE